MHALPSPYSHRLCDSGGEQWSEYSPRIRHPNASLGPGFALGEKGKKMGERSEPRVVGLGRKNVLSMRELFCPDPLARYEKIEGFQIFFCLIIKRFHS